MSAYPPPGAIGPRIIAAWALRTKADGITVEGLDRVPNTGPVLIVARHVHHLLDAAIAIDRVKRPIHVVVALDWTADSMQRRWMERACRWAQWPVILRPATTGLRGGYDPTEVQRYLRSGLRTAADLLRDERVVMIFPEGYPVIDPAAPARSQPRDADGFLPFASGFRTVAKLAHRRGANEIAIVPLGFRYEPHGARWRIVARFGEPLDAHAGVAAVERAVRALSA